MMSKRLEDQDSKFLTLRALLLDKANWSSTQNAFLSSEKAIDGRSKDDATWGSSPTLIMADIDMDQQAEEGAIPQASNESDAGSNGEDCTVQSAMNAEQSRLDHSSALYDPCREVSKESSPAIEETAQTPSSPLSSVRSSILDEGEDNVESDQQYAMPEVSVHEEDSPSDQAEDSTKGSDEEDNDPVRAHSSTRPNGWSEREIGIVRDTMYESEDWDIPMAERYRLCEQRLREKGFRRGFLSCQQLWNTRLAPADRPRRQWSEREIEIMRDTMREFGNQSTPMPERFLLCEQRLRDQGFGRTYFACRKLWNANFVSSDRKRRPAWSKEEIELLHETMKELEGDSRPLFQLFSICEKRLEEKGFKRSAYACNQRYARDRAEEEHVWTKDQIHLLGKAFQATIGAYGQNYSDQRFKRISEMLNNTGEMTVYVTAKACMKHWYRIPAEARWKIEEELPMPGRANPAVHSGQKSTMPLVVGNSSLAEEISAEHTEQSSYLLGHLAIAHDSGLSQELQKQDSSHIDQSALCNVEREVEEPSVALISACQGPTTSPPSTRTTSKLPIIEVTEILPQSQIIEQSPDIGRTTQAVAEEAMDEQALNEDLNELTAIAATTEGVAEQHEVDNAPESTQDEPCKPSDPTPRDSYAASTATVKVVPANSRCYEGMQTNFEPGLAAQGHNTDQMTLDEPCGLSVDRSSGGGEEPSAADLAAAVADEIAEHCDETTTGWKSMDIGFWIADSN